LITETMTLFTRLFALAKVVGHSSGEPPVAVLASLARPVMKL